MPIRPEHRHLYGPVWRRIRAAILERAGHRCDEPGCRIGDGWLVQKDLDGRVVVVGATRRARISPVDAQMQRLGQPVTEIVLTVHHADGNPANNDPRNLLALCQRHHLACHRRRNPSPPAGSSNAAANPGR